MPRPKKLRIGHMTFTVEGNTKEVLAQDAHGLYIESQRRIVLQEDLPADKEREALVHEVLHGCFDAANLDLDDKKEERLVAALTGPLLAVLRDNPKLIAYLQE